MAVARSTKEVFDYVLKEDRELPKEKQTVFHLRRLSTRHAVRARDLAEDQGRMCEFALRAGVAGWDNFADEDGKAVECRHDKGSVPVFGIDVAEPMSMDSLNRIPPHVVGELATAIITGNTLTSDDVKN
jgi:hypothetical protein